MKKHVSLLVVVAILAIGVQSHAAFWNGAVSTPPYGSVSNVENFDWSSSGSGMISGLTNLVPGQPFVFRYQANLVGYNAPGGASIPDPNLNVNYEFTVVTLLNELVNSVTVISPGILQESFVTVNGSFAIYYDDLNAGPGVQSNTPAGTGFNDGQLVANGTWNPNQVSSYMANFNTGIGSGSSTLFGQVAWYDPAFFNPALPLIMQIRWEGTLNAPPLDSTTASFFDGNNGYAITPVTVFDFLLKVDGSSKLQTVPEPGTVVLMGLGLLGMVGLSRKKSKK